MSLLLADDSRELHLLHGFLPRGVQFGIVLQRTYYLNEPESLSQRPFLPPYYYTSLQQLDDQNIQLTGKWGALAIKSPLGAKIAQEKSNLSLILVEIAVFCNISPIDSATLINLFANKESKIGLGGDFVEVIDSSFCVVMKWRELKK